MKYEKYKKIFDKHGGVIKLSEFTNYGYHNTILYKLIEEGFVSKIKTGYYEWIADDLVPEVAIISKVFPEAVICLESALYIYGYTDRTPISWHVVVSKNNNKGKYTIDYPPIKFYFIVDKYIGIGKTTIVYDNNEVSIYDRERTICDIIRYEKKMDKEVFNVAIKAYVKDTKKNIGNLMKYAEEMNIKNKVNIIIGMWL
jgi:predicted transcriptional regulator of viral defense system